MSELLVERTLRHADDLAVTEQVLAAAADRFDNRRVRVESRKPAEIPTPSR